MTLPAIPPPRHLPVAPAPRSAPVGTAERPVPLIIDSDPGLDDALAIGLAVARPEIDLLAVTDFPDWRMKSFVRSQDEGILMVLPREGPSRGSMVIRWRPRKPWSPKRCPSRSCTAHGPTWS